MAKEASMCPGHENLNCPWSVMPAGAFCLRCGETRTDGGSVEEVSPDEDRFITGEDPQNNGHGPCGASADLHRSSGARPS